MKKIVLIVLSALVLSTGMVLADSNKNKQSLTDAIRFYKAGNYASCYTALEEFIKEDSSNALAYYYMGMTSVQLGRKDEAIQNYEKAIILSSDNNLAAYAKRGKLCLEEPDKCKKDVSNILMEDFLYGKNKIHYAPKVKDEFEHLKIQNFMREMNRKDNIEPGRFKEYKDFSSAPTDEEIKVAIQTLQRAGFENFGNRGSIDYLSLTGDSTNSILNMMGASSSMNAQLIQSLLTNNITQGF